MANGKQLIANALYPVDGRMLRGWILIDGKHIAATGTGEAPEGIRRDAGSIIIASDIDLVMPGMIDTHVHFREPGLEHKGNISTESKAAVLGGVTSFIEMPNTKPATTTAEAHADKLARAEGRSYANYAFMLGAVRGVTDQLDKLPADRFPAVKLFLGTTTGAVGMPDSEEMERMMRWCADHDVPVVVHAEDNEIIDANTADAIARYGSREAVPVSEHSAIRSREACLSGARKAIALAAPHGTRLHIAHVSTADEARELLHSGDWREKKVTAETTPMYLDEFFADPANRTGRHKINPSIKTPADAAGLRKAVIDGRIDTIATDHAPHLAAEKEGGALTAASGAPSVQFALPVLLGYFPPELIAEKMASVPAQLFALAGRGEIKAGMFADLVILKRENHTITDADVEAPCGWTPFDGRSTDYRVDRVWVNGHLSVDGGKVCSAPAGEALTTVHG